MALVGFAPNLPFLHMQERIESAVFAHCAISRSWCGGGPEPFAELVGGGPGPFA